MNPLCAGYFQLKLKPSFELNIYLQNREEEDSDEFTGFHFFGSNYTN